MHHESFKKCMLCTITAKIVNKWATKIPENSWCTKIYTINISECKSGNFG